MSYITVTIELEAEKMSALLGLYEKQLGTLPKGSLRVKERNGKKYFKGNSSILLSYYGLVKRNDY